MAVDRYWNSVPLLVTCSASPFVETRHAYTVNQGTTTVTFTSSVKPGAAWAGSADFSGVTSAADGISGTMLWLEATDDFTLGTGDFTIEAWVSVDDLDLPNDSGGAPGSQEYLPHPVVERSDGTATGAWSLEFYAVRTQGTPDVATYGITFYCGAFHASNAMLSYFWTSDGTITGTPTANPPFDWMHLAVTRNGNEWTLWKQGVPMDREISTVTIPGGPRIRIGNSILDTSSAGLSQTNGRSLEGNIADVRITKGFCRYGRSFEAAFTGNEGPGAPHPTSEDTGDYSSDTFRGATGSQGADAGLAEEGEPGEGGSGVPISLPPPLDRYDQQNETQTRRLIEAATRR